MNECHCNQYEDFNSRRDFLKKIAMGFGGIALSHIMAPYQLMADAGKSAASATAGISGVPHFPPKAKRVIYLFQSGAPSQVDCFDYKPLLTKRMGEELPRSVIGEQRLTGMTSGQKTLPMAGTISPFTQHGQSARWISDLFPHTSKIVDELCFIHSMYTEAINHDPGVTFLQTGSQLPGRPSIGSWLNYGLGSDNENLPAFCVLVTKGKDGQPLYSRLWGNGFLPAEYQGIQFRSGKDPVLYLENPPGIKSRSKQLDYLKELQQIQFQKEQDPEIEARIAQYEMAYRMQTSVPEVMDISGEPQHVLDMYGPDVKEPGTYAANCLLARRLVEKGVKFVQLYHQGWDNHGGLPEKHPQQAKETDQPSAGLVMDLKQRGLLDDTLVIWGGEFGRTAYAQGDLKTTGYGRDHHPKCFTLWMAGGGVKPGFSWGKTDDFAYNIVENPVHIHDFQATLLHLLGIDHEKLTFKYQGRRFRLTDVHGHVVKEILA